MNENELEDLEAFDADTVLGAGVIKKPRIDKHGTIETVGGARDAAYEARDESVEVNEPNIDLTPANLNPDRP